MFHLIESQAIYDRLCWAVVLRSLILISHRLIYTRIKLSMHKLSLCIFIDLISIVTSYLFSLFKFIILKSTTENTVAYVYQQI